MPELPEVQAHAERLDAALRGVVLTGFEPLSFTALKTFDPPASAAVGRPLTGVRRRGKHLLLGFDADADADAADAADAGLAFVVHLMQGGRLRADTGKARKPRGALARWRLDDATTPALLLTEAGTEHKAGVWLIAGDPLGVPPLDHLGPEADTLDGPALAALFRERSMRLHGFLRDQRILAGLGRRLANEVCWRARLSPFAQTRTLGEEAAAAVADGIRGAVADGLDAERARTNMSASKERPGAVHGRIGQPCPRCGDRVRAVEYRGYTVAYCSACQTGGKVLADNTTSKFLK